MPPDADAAAAAAAGASGARRCRCARLPRLWTLAPLLSAALFSLSLAWLSLLPAVTVTTGEAKPRGTYMSENALMPNAAEAGVDAGDVAWAAGERFGGKWDEVCFPVLTRTRSERACHHVLPTWEAGDRRDAIVLVAKPTTEARRVVLSLGRRLADVRWLSKRVVLVAPDTVAELAAWFAAYTLNRTLDIPRVGPIRGAIVVDVDAFKETDRGGHARAVLAQGGNGQQANMDLVNVAVQALSSTVPPQVDVVPHEFAQSSVVSTAASRLAREVVSALRSAGIRHPAMSDVQSRAETGAAYAAQVAFGPSGWHAVFIDGNVDAITMRFRLRPDEHPIHATVDAARAVERVVRSLSNLDEQLHHSYFLYILLSPKSFVSVEEYLWPLVLLCAPLALSALATARARAVRDGFAQAWSATFAVGVALTLGAAVWRGGYVGDSAAAWAYGLFLAGAAVARVANPHAELFDPADFDPEARTDPSNWECHKAAAQLLLLWSLVALGTLFFPLAVMLALVYVPVAWMVRPPPSSLAECGWWMAGAASLLVAWPPTLVRMVRADMADEFWACAGWNATSGDVADALASLACGERAFGFVHLGVACVVLLPAHMVLSGVHLGLFGSSSSSSTSSSSSLTGAKVAAAATPSWTPLPRDFFLLRWPTSTSDSGSASGAQASATSAASSPSKSSSSTS